MAFCHTSGWRPAAGILKSVSSSGNRYGALAVRWGNASTRDLQNEWFSPDTSFSWDAPAVLINHGVPIAESLAKFSELKLGTPAIKRQVDGLFADFSLDENDPVEAAIISLINDGAFRWSSGSKADLVQRTPDGEIRLWPILEVSLTAMPAEPRLPAITAL